MITNKGPRPLISLPNNTFKTDNTNGKTPTPPAQSKFNTELEITSSLSSAGTAVESIQIPSEFSVGCLALIGVINSSRTIDHHTHKRDLIDENYHKLHHATEHWKTCMSNADRLGEQLHEFINTYPENIQEQAVNYLKTQHSLRQLHSTPTIPDKDSKSQKLKQALKTIKKACELIPQKDSLFEMIDKFTEAIQITKAHYHYMGNASDERSRKRSQHTEKIHEHSLMLTGYTAEVASMSCSLAHLISVATPLAIVSGGCLVSGRVYEAFTASEQLKVIEENLAKTIKFLDQNIPKLENFLNTTKQRLSLRKKQLETTMITSSTSAGGSGLATAGTALLVGGITAPIGIALMGMGATAVIGAAFKRLAQEDAYKQELDTIPSPNLVELEKDLKNNPTLRKTFAEYLGVNVSVLEGMNDINELVNTPELSAKTNQRSSDG